MENFTIQGRYLKLCNDFRAFIMKAAFYTPDYQNQRMIKRLGGACFKTCDQGFETLSRAFEDLREN